MSDDPGARLAREAALHIGVRFRLHGRDPATGLDCIGLVIVSARALGICIDVSAGYQLRNAAIADRLARAELGPLVCANGPIRSGDICLIRPAPAQHHLAIADGNGAIIHAHAGLRRVVREPLSPRASMEMRWRLPCNLEGY